MLVNPEKNLESISNSIRYSLFSYVPTAKFQTFAQSLLHYEVGSHTLGRG